MQIDKAFDPKHRARSGWCWRRGMRVQLHR